MAVSKHNFWKRKKNGLMKLVRSHREWLEQQREARMRKLGHRRTDIIGKKQWWDKKSNTSTPSVKPVKQDSAKRTQIGKKI
jgi:hypothetical protein